jgi:hypothetical protein
VKNLVLRSFLFSIFLSIGACMEASKNFYKVDDIVVTGIYLDPKNQLHLVFVTPPETNYYSSGIKLRVVNSDESEITFTRAPIKDISSVPTDYAAVLLSKWKAAEKRPAAEKIQVNPAYAQRPNQIVVLPFSGQRLFAVDGKTRVLIFTKSQ